MKKLKITFNGKSFYATLFTDKAPKIIAAIERQCPAQSRLIAAKLCDHEITWQLHVFLDELENPVFEQEPGSVIFYPARQAICVFYGETTPVCYCNKFAQIDPQDLPAFYEQAQTVWHQQGGTVLTEIVDV